MNTDGLELEYVWMIEFLHELYFFHLVGSIGLLFVHFHHHYVASPQVKKPAPRFSLLKSSSLVRSVKAPLRASQEGVRPQNEAILGLANSLEYECFHDICNRINILL